MDGLSIRNIQNSVEGLGQSQSQSLQKQSQNKSTNPQGGESFSDTLKSAIYEVDKLQKVADVKMQKLATGQSQDIHGTMISAEKAEIALRLMVQVRNKIISAYQEIMKMQV